MKLKCYFLLLMTLIISINLQSQEPCGVDIAMDIMIDQDPNYLSLLESFNQSYAAALPTSNNGGATDGTYEIPLVFHVLHNYGPENVSDEQIYESIDQLNSQFAGGEGGFDTKITFYLASLDPYGECTSGINRIQTAEPGIASLDFYSDTYMKNLSRWPVDNYINVWIVKYIGSGNVAGYSYIPPVTGDVDGVVIHNEFLGTTETGAGNVLNTLSHEIGHYLSLYHPWGPSFTAQCGLRCGDPNDCENWGDRVCDTGPSLSILLGGSCSDDFFGCENCPNQYLNQPFAKDNYMSYNHSCQDRFTEGQAQRMWFALDEYRPDLWSSQNQLCTGITTHLGHNITVTGNETWTTSSLPNAGDGVITGTLTIEDGARLTVDDGVVLRFCESGRVVVEKGGFLINEGTFTNACEAPWIGVEVRGTTGAAQGNYFNHPDHGVYIGRSGSLIENAHIGLKLYGPDYLSDAGGMTSCYKASFNNCTTSVRFAPYDLSGDYSAYINQCTFTNDGSFLPFESFLDMNDVKGIRITGSTFTYSGPNTGGDIEGYGYGIWAKNSGFKLKSKSNYDKFGNPTGVTRCEFNGLGYGVWIANLLGNKYYEIEQATFDNTYVGIYNSGMSLGEILFNDFNFGSVPDPALISSDDKAQIGVMLTNPISGITFQQNDFNGTGGASFNEVGTISQNIGSFDNKIEKNNFNQLTFANIATDKCGEFSTTTSRGLLYLCNSQGNSAAGDLVLSDGPNTTTRVHNRQWNVVGLDDVTGDLISEAAGNTFSHNGLLNGDLNNEDSYLHRYHYFNGNPLEEPIDFDSGWVPTENDPNSTCSELLCEPPCPIIIIHEPLPDIKVALLNVKDDWTKLCTYYLPYPHNPYTTLSALDPVIGDYLTGLQQMMDPLICKGLQIIASDSIGVYESEYLWWVRQINSYEGDLWLASEYISDGDYTRADEIISAIPSKWELKSGERIEFENYLRVYEVAKTNNISTLDHNSLKFLEEIYKGDQGYASGWAANILNGNGIKTSISYYLPNRVDARSYNSDNNKASEKFGVFPNPSSNEITVKLDEKSFESGMIQISSLQGERVVYQKVENNSLVSIRNLLSGVYYYSILDENGKIIHSNKLLVIK